MQERRSQNRRASDEDIQRRLKGLEERMAEVESTNYRLALGVDRNNVQTGEMYELFDMARSFFKVIGYIGRALDWVWLKMKPLMWILALGSAIAYYAKTGQFKWPQWP